MDIRKFCSVNGFDLDYNGGFFIRGSDRRVLTGIHGTVEALEAAELPLLDAILVADRVITPSEETITRYRANLKKAEADINGSRPARLAKHAELLPHAGNEIIDEVLSHVKRVIDAAPLHLAEIERCRSLAANAPSRLFLPLGTSVRLKREWNVPDHYAIDPSLLSYIAAHRVSRPPEGSVGYVTGAGYGSDECGIVVAFPDEFIDGKGRKWRDTLHGSTKLVQMSDLEVIQFATLPDGTPNLSVDGANTHSVTYEDDEVVEMMILENGGKTMVFFLGDDFDPLDESVHFFASMEEAVDLHGEIERLHVHAIAP
ncbi:hypothetical protein D3C71_264050 [compost metagenome]